VAIPTTSVGFSSGSLSRTTHPSDGTAWSFSAWIRPYAPQGYARPTAFCWGAAGDSPWFRLTKDRFAPDNSVHLYAFANWPLPAFEDQWALGSEITDGGWQWVGFIVTTGSVAWWRYVAGTDTMYSGTETVGNIPAVLSDHIWVGTGNGLGTVNWAGKISGLLMWSASLTSVQLLAEKDSPDPIVTSNLHAAPDLTNASTAATDLAGVQDFTVDGTLTTETDAPPYPVPGTDIFADLTASASITAGIVGAGVFGASLSGTATASGSISALGIAGATVAGSTSIVADLTSQATPRTITADISGSVSFVPMLGAGAYVTANVAAGVAPSATEVAVAVWSAAYHGLQATGSFGRLAAELYRLQGLEVDSPLAVGPTSRTAGDVAQLISTIGETVTVQRT